MSTRTRSRASENEEVFQILDSDYEETTTVSHSSKQLEGSLTTIEGEMDLTITDNGDNYFIRASNDNEIYSARVSDTEYMETELGEQTFDEIIETAEFSKMY